MPKKEKSKDVGGLRADFGIFREGKHSSSKFFLFYVTPTGSEIGLKSCPHIKKERSKSKGEYMGDEWSVIADYSLQHPIRIKVVNYYTTLGERKKNAQVYIEVDGIGEKIQIKGFHGLGGVEFRGYIDWDMSNVDEETLTNHYSYEVISPAKFVMMEENGVKPRRLII